MKILTTGGSGFTGQYFKIQAEAEGHTIWALQADLTDKAALCAEVIAAQPEAIVHLGAISFVGHSDETAFYKVNVVGTTNLLSAAASLSTRPRCVIVASSANVYGNCEASPIWEAQSPAPVNHYATSKLAMEHMARTFSDRLPIIVTRPFNYTGRGQAQQFLIPKLVSHFARRAPQIELGNLHVEREFNDVRMVADAYLSLLSQGRAGEVYNVCTGHTYGLQHVVAMLEQLTGHNMEVRVNPAFVRPNEVFRLCGDPRKLIAATGTLRSPSLEETLHWMLEQQP